MLRTGKEKMDVEVLVWELKEDYMGSIDIFQAAMMKDLSTGWKNAPKEEAIPLVEEIANLMKDIVKNKMEEQREAIVQAAEQFVQDRENGTAISPEAMYEALYPVEAAIKEAVENTTAEWKKNYKEYSRMWLWCGYILYRVEQLVTTVASDMREGMRKRIASVIRGE